VSEDVCVRFVFSDDGLPSPSKGSPSLPPSLPFLPPSLLLHDLNNLMPGLGGHIVLQGGKTIDPDVRQNV